MSKLTASQVREIKRIRTQIAINKAARAKAVSEGRNIFYYENKAKAEKKNLEKELTRKMEVICGINGCQRRRHLTCKNCGDKGLTGAAWRLRDHDGIVHTCYVSVKPVEHELPSAPGVKATVSDAEMLSKVVADLAEGLVTKEFGEAAGTVTLVPTPVKNEPVFPSMEMATDTDEAKGGLPNEGEGEGEGALQSKPEDNEDLAKIIYDRIKPFLNEHANEFMESKVNEEVGSVIEDTKKDFAEQIKGLVEANEKLVDDLETAIEAGAEEAIDKRSPPIEIQLKKPDKTVTTIKGQHKMFPYLLKLAGARLNVMLVGPAGSGKTRGAEEAAKVLGLGFYPKSLGPATTEHSMMGYQDATGKYVTGILHKPFVSGGLLLLDEIDSANAAAITTLNTALANPYCSFPHKVEDKHEDFIVVASGNTYGRGADREYVGRTQLDAATLDRFSVLNWDYDLTLEKQIAEGMAKTLGTPQIIEWMEYVHILRKAIKDTNVRMVASTRSIIDGGVAVASGLSIDEVAKLRFWNSVDKDTYSKVTGKIGLLKLEADEKKLKRKQKQGSSV